MGGTISADRELSTEITWRLQRSWECFQLNKMEIYDRPGAFRLKIRLLKAEVIDAVLCSCMAWSPNNPNYDRLRQVHHAMLPRCLGWGKRKRDDNTLSSVYALAKTASEIIEATVRKWRIVSAVFVARIGGGASVTEGYVWKSGWRCVLLREATSYFGWSTWSKICRRLKLSSKGDERLQRRLADCLDGWRGGRDIHAGATLRGKL